MNKGLLANFVKSRRLDLNISQRELASRMRCDVKTISEIEKGIRKKPKISTLEKLSEELFIEIDDLLDYAGYSDEELSIYYEDYDEIGTEEDVKQVPFDYVITIIGKGLIDSDNEKEAKKEVAEFISDALCGSIGFNKEWDEILETSDNNFVLINVKKEK